ncbi:MAG: glycosyltransferase [Acidocella sp.]|nr:glycosyltransferase [Acidocella sp.]
MGTQVLQELSTEIRHDRPWFYFDLDYYIGQCLIRGMMPTVSSKAAYLEHYLTIGSRSGLSPNSLFDEEYYLLKYPDVAQEIQLGHWSCGFEHYTKIGALADLSPTWFFDGIFYKNTCPDLSDKNLLFGGFNDRYTHYLLVGVGERRASNWIVHSLKKIKPKLTLPSTQESLRNFLSDDNRMAAVFKPLLDYDWMKEKYDWGRAVTSSTFVKYYLLNVKDHQISPSAYFDEKYYLSSEPEVQAAVAAGIFSGGYEHFILHGMDEWRRPFERFDPHYYYETNMKGTIGTTPPQSPFVHFLSHRQKRRLPIAPPLMTLDIPENMGKGIYERRCALNANQLGTLKFGPAAQTPDVSVIIIARENYEQTANCIISAVFNTQASLEIIVFDNASTDETRNLPLINPRIKYLRADENLGFTIAVNRAVEVATGRVILLLNNDMELTPRAIDLAVETLDSDTSIGAVGGKIIRMHGRLQEGGSIVWRDGTCLGYGRDKDPLDGQVNFVRDVDFCSGCFLAIMRSEWEEIGGFDEAFAPAYYEETDLCVRIWERGKRVVYDPRIAVWHFEFGSSALREEPLTLMRRNQRYFAKKHRAFLADCLPGSAANVERAKVRHVSGLRTLFVEDMIPDPTKGMGFVRSSKIAKILQEECGLVSVLGLHNNKWPSSLPGDAQGRRSEILTGVNVNNMEEFLRDRIGVYDTLWFSRTHNLRYLKVWRQACPEFFTKTRIILDTEAISASRRHAYAQLVQQPADLSDLLLEEFEHLDGVDHICVVNELDRIMLRRSLKQRGLSIPVSILGHALAVQPKPTGFKGRSDIVLVGSYSQMDGPNADGLLWFDRAVRPLLADLPGVNFVIAGSKAASFVEAADLLHDYKVISDPPDMSAVYNNALIMVAPTRFAAGMPMKAHEAASHGVPVVMTELLARQLGWFQERVAATPAEPEPMAAAIRNLASNSKAWRANQELQAALVARDCNPERFEAIIRQIIANPKTETFSDAGFEHV